MDKQLLTARDIADALGHKKTAHVYALIRAGQLPAVKVGKRGVRIPRQAFEEYLAALNRAARASCADKFAEAFTESLAQAGPALAAILTPSAEAIARDKGAEEGFAMYLRNNVPR